LHPAERGLRLQGRQPDQALGGYVEENRESADRFIAAQVEAGQCAVFKPGDRLRILRYVGMRRLEVQRAGETERFIMLLK
jgi:hypothetical protein